MTMTFVNRAKRVCRCPLFYYLLGNGQIMIFPCQTLMWDCNTADRRVSKLSPCSCQLFQLLLAQFPEEWFRHGSAVSQCHLMPVQLALQKSTGLANVLCHYESQADAAGALRWLNCVRWFVQAVAPFPMFLPAVSYRWNTSRAQPSADTSQGLLVPPRKQAQLSPLSYTLATVSLVASSVTWAVFRKNIFFHFGKLLTCMGKPDLASR